MVLLRLTGWIGTESQKETSLDGTITSVMHKPPMITKTILQMVKTLRIKSGIFKNLLPINHINPTISITPPIKVNHPNTNLYFVITYLNLRKFQLEIYKYNTNL